MSKQPLVELIHLIKLNLGDGLDDELLNLPCAELFDFAKSPVERELQNGDPVLKTCVVY